MTPTLIVVLLLNAYLASSNAICVPGSVPNITLSTNYTLTWDECLNPQNCTITNYIINILDEGTIYQYQTNSSVLTFNVSFLENCKKYGFEVHALTDESVLGPSVQLLAETSLPEGYDLTLGTLNSLTYNKSIQIDWNLKSINLDRCISYYRVVYWDENNQPQDYYSASKNFTLANRIPCTNYTFQVNAIIVNPDIQGPIAEITNVVFAEVPAVPKIALLETTETSVEMVWELEKYATNHCQLLFLNITTAGLPTNLTYLEIPIIDNLSRPNVTVNITGLEPNSVYVSQVSVVNVGGASKNVTVSYQTTDTYVFDFIQNVL
ncbi:uncharacterized protein LOC126739597 [Anthonomus grandis grandis]|uniref:uncharacterized protein LOC126739597 n=1 Tax=Anthonomus grandis grandis TaxID=2921223 RepID=UPI00216543D7|nr:uncharacterized protein LOC126739597 [Anthonomus grandis grandis]